MTTTTAAHPPLPPFPPRAPRSDPRTTLRLDHSRELLGLLPYQLGFHPRDSAVAVSLRGRDREVGLISRIGLPDVLGPQGPDLLGSMAGHLARDGAGEVVVVVYDDGPDPRDPDRGLRVDGRARAVRGAERIRAVLGCIAVVTVWVVAQDRYLGLDCRDPGCCPPGGRPVADLAAGGLVGRMTGRCANPGRDPRELPEDIALASAGPRRSASAARARWLDVLLRAVRPSEVLGWRQHSLDAWRGALASALEHGPGGDPGLGPAQLGRIEAALDDRTVRDAVVLTLVDPAAGLADALVRHAPDGLAARRRAGFAGPGGGAGARAGAGAHGERDDGGLGGRVLDDDARLGAEGDASDEPDGQDGELDADETGYDVHGLGLDADGGRSHAEGGGFDGAAVGLGADSRRCCAADRGSDAVHGDPVGEHACPEAELSDAVRRGLGVLVDPEHAREPQEDLVGAARVVLEAVVAHGRQERQAPALTLLALMAWWAGDAVRACALVERALVHDPGHRLAEILDRTLGAGLPPGWMRRRC